MRVIIVGGVAGGASAAARIRRLDERAEIVMYERGDYISYANCALPYYIGGAITEREDLTLHTPEDFYARFRVEVKIRHEVMLLEPNAKRVLVKDLTNGNEYYDRYDKIVLAPGAKPIVPSVKGLDDPRVFTLRNLPDTFRIYDCIERKQPKTAAVVGGGFIGLEVAENLKKRGIAVTLVEMGQHLLSTLDADVAAEAQNAIRRNGLNILLNSGVKEVIATEDGLKLRLSDAEIGAEMVILAVGVRPDTEFLKDCGVERTPRGAIIINERCETSVKDVYAAGDATQAVNFVTGGSAYVPLAGIANKQGRIAANNICGVPDEYRASTGCAVLKLFDTTVASVGMNERQAKEAGLRFEKVYLWASSHASYYPDATNMSIKALAEVPTGKLLGAQIVGKEGVDKRIDVFATAIRGGLTAFDLCDLDLAYAPPYSSARDPVNTVGYIAENILTGKVKQWYVEDLPELDGRQNVERLDVRTAEEVKRGAIPNTDKFIPLDELRERLAELDPAKPVYVNCQSGLRSYLACRILTQNGFTAYNLAGGYRLYAALAKNGADGGYSYPCGIEKK